VRWAWRWIALVLVLSSAAYLFAYLFPPEGQVFLGFLANNDDNQLYLSYMREGAAGAWLTTVRFTPEAHEPALLLPVYQVLGKAARLSGLPHEAVFHLSRLAGGILLLVAAYWVAALCLQEQGARRTAFLLICFSSGFGWLLVVSRLADRVVLPVDIRVPEASTFLTIFASPHFVLGVTFQLLTMGCVLQAGRRGGYLVGAAVSMVLLSLTLVYNVIVVGVALGLYALLRCWQERRVHPALWQTAAVGLAALPVVAYDYVLLRFVPFWRVVYGENDVVRTPGPLAVLLGYGLVIWLAAWGLGSWMRRREWRPARMMVAAWVVSNGLLLYAPLAFQGKLLAGWHAGLCVAAAAGVHEGLLPWLGRQAWFRRLAERAPGARWTARNVTVILTIPSTLLVALVGFRVAATVRYFPYYLPEEDVAAVAWLDAHLDAGDVLLSSYGIGNYLVAHTEARSFLGHQFAVVDRYGKDRAMRHFYSGGASEAEQRALVEAHGVTYVYHGRLERGLGTWDPAGVAWLVQATRRGGTAVYRVEERGG
jgi:hypothetical protein